MYVIKKYYILKIIVMLCGCLSNISLVNKVCNIIIIVEIIISFLNDVFNENFVDYEFCFWLFFKEILLFCC